MAAIGNNIRDVYSLTNEEIIGLVDFIFPDGGGNMETVMYNRKAMKVVIYRKIEIVPSFDEGSIFCRVTFGFSDESKSLVTGFELLSNLDDYCFTSLSKAYIGDAYFKKLGINFDFSAFNIEIRALYKHLEDNLKMWGDEFAYYEQFPQNPEMMKVFNSKGLGSYIVQEVHSPVIEQIS
ncbi:MAG: hypothetical protein V4456_11595 [Bacteroidota bacterium]